MLPRIHILCLALSLVGLPHAFGENDVDFSHDIKPIFAKHCFSCHGPDASEGGLQLHDEKTALGELDSGARAIVPQKPEESALLERVSSEEDYLHMPPEGDPLSEEQISLLRRWIAQGAPWEGHWAFRPPTPQEPPEVENGAWVKNPIDAFILRRLEDRDLSPAPPADKAALLRRAYYDLTGLPPTPEQVDAFLQDDSPDAFERVVDRLLRSPRYGERWARHWLDLVRFAETNSFERDGLKPNAWKYRDYVIRSFNDDKPYDQFIREQLAGDELDETTKDTLIATGYYRLGIWDDEPADPLLARFDELDGILTTTSQVFLGLTINCARCHDHKIDPISQVDYYSMLSFFADLTPYGTRGDQQTNSQTDVSPPELVAQYTALDKRERKLSKETRVIEQRGIEKMSAEDQRKSEGPGRKKLLEKKLRDYLSDADWAEYERLRQQAQETREARKSLPPRETVLSVARCIAQPAPMHVLQRGSPHSPGEQVEPNFPVLFQDEPPQIPKAPADARSAGRRRVLAEWIASEENMLTARVMANRLWQHHFGRGLARLPNNFGQLGTPPTHPKLLDWLAAKLVEGGWRLKPMHKLMMMSNAYQMSSRGNAEALAADPANDLFWRFDMRRLSAEEIRDAILAVNGRLNTKMFGPGFYPEISKDVLHGQSRPGSGWGVSSLEERARRSVYIHVKRSLVTPFLETFDFPETDVSCEARFATTQPSQALAMLNSGFINNQAAAFAERLRREAGDDRREQVELALRLALCRPIEAEEVDAGVALIERLEKEHDVEPDDALQYYCLTVLNINEFLYLD